MVFLASIVQDIMRAIELLHARARTRFHALGNACIRAELLSRPRQHGDIRRVSAIRQYGRSATLLHHAIENMHEIAFFRPPIRRMAIISLDARCAFGLLIIHTAASIITADV